MGETLAYYCHDNHCFDAIWCQRMAVGDCLQQHRRPQFSSSDFFMSGAVSMLLCDRWYPFLHVSAAQAFFIHVAAALFLIT